MLSLCELDSTLLQTEVSDDSPTLTFEERLRAKLPNDPIAKSVRTAIAAGSQKMYPYLPDQLQGARLPLSLSYCRFEGDTLLISDRVYLAEIPRTEAIELSHDGPLMCI